MAAGMTRVASVDVLPSYSRNITYVLVYMYLVCSLGINHNDILGTFAILPTPILSIGDLKVCFTDFPTGINSLQFVLVG